jgi:hypothetical protein
MFVNWKSSYTNENRLDVISKALTVAINNYFAENYVCREIEVVIKRIGDRDIALIKDLENK